MSYELYSYKSVLGRPDIEEALTVIESETGDELEADASNKLRIADALIELNPRLRRFDLTSAETNVIPAYLEINTPDGDLATQITIFENYVSISVPFWYSGDDAEAVFAMVSGYTRAIRHTAGYFVYDPQTENVYDPLAEDFNGLGIYQSIVVPGQKPDKPDANNKKQWWRFW